MSEDTPAKDTHHKLIERTDVPADQQRGEITPSDLPGDQKPEDVPGLPGAEGGSDSGSADVPPGLPAKDSSPLGDTDQHSDA